MDAVYDDAWIGKLTKARLEEFLTSSPSSVDESHGKKSVTLLSAVTRGGSLELVRFLLDNPHAKANPSAPSTNGFFPLYYATTQVPLKDRAAIVRVLLNAGADPNTCSSKADDYTPLMNAITQARDKATVEELVDHNADPKVAKKGTTAESLAKGTPFSGSLKPKAQRQSSFAAIVSGLLATVMVIYGYVNALANNVLERMFGLKGVSVADKDLDKSVDDMKQDISDKVGAQIGAPSSNNPSDPKDSGQDPKKDPRSVEDFADALGEFVKDSGLEQLYPRDDPFLQTLAKNAAKLRADPNTDLGSPENLRRLTRLTLYQPVLYCDDSGSMGEKDGTDTTRFEKLRELVKRITSVATKLLPEDSKMGIHLRFINKSDVYDNRKEAEIEGDISKASPGGGTALGRSLNKHILEPLVYKPIDDPNRRLERPLLVCTITDGCPDSTDKPSFKDCILNCLHKVVDAGYDENSVMFSISQIGEAESATQFIDNLRNDDEIKDVIYCTTDRLDSKFKELAANERRMEVWLLEMLTKPLMGEDN